MPDLEKLRALAERQTALFSDPHPGLASWQQAVRDLWLEFGAEAWGPALSDSDVLLAVLRDDARYKAAVVDVLDVRVAMARRGLVVL